MWQSSHQYLEKATVVKSYDWLRGLVVPLRQVYGNEPAEYAERVRNKPVMGTVWQQYDSMSTHKM
jgi:hypothetical protein